MLDAIGVIKGGYQKKKTSGYIIPSPPPLKNLQKPEADLSQSLIVSEKVPPPSPQEDKPPLQKEGEGVSAFSISSIKYKKSLLPSGNQQDSYRLPQKEFSQTDLEEAWKKITEQAEQKGEEASVFRISKVKADSPHKIFIEVPTESSKQELCSQEKKLSKLKEILENHHVEISIIVNDSIEKKYAISLKEKYEQLKQENPSIEYFINKLGLEIR